MQQNFIGKEVGNYLVTEPIAAGAFGTVYKAQHRFLTQRTVAIKILQAHINTPEEQTQFIQEAQFLEQLRHPYILPIFDIGFIDGFPYLVTEFAVYGSLRQRLRQRGSTLLPWETILQILTQIGQALQHAHLQNVIHRDLKPENILFAAQDRAVLADFGIATMLGSSSIKYTSAIGTPSYMAPEQFLGTICRENDQYALGCIAYELVTGQQPFRATDFIALGFLHTSKPPISPRLINPALPAGIERAILQAMAKERNQRHSDIATFIVALQSNVQGPFAETIFVASPPVPNIVAPTILAAPAQQIGRTVLMPAEPQITATILVASPSQAIPTVLAGPAHREDVKRRAKELIKEGQAYYQEKEFLKAIAAFERALRLEPENLKAHMEMGQMLYKQKRYNEALNAFDQVNRLDPTNVNALTMQGHTLRALERYQEAIVVYNRALLQDKDNQVALDGKRIANSKQEKQPPAPKQPVQELKKKQAPVVSSTMVVKQPTQEPKKTQPDPLALYTKGCEHLKKKDLQNALSAFEKAFGVDPGNPIVCLEMGNTLYQLGRYEEAIKKYDLVISPAKKYIRAYIGKGYALIALYRYEDAFDTFEAALCIKSTNEDAIGGYKSAAGKLNPLSSRRFKSLFKSFLT